MLIKRKGLISFKWCFLFHFLMRPYCIYMLYSTLFQGFLLAL